MRQITRRAAAFSVVLGLLAGLSGPASAQVLPDEMRTMVFLLLDTSGSMEYTLAQPTPDVPYPLPECTSTPEKNRWLIALEVLTGSTPPGSRSCVFDLRQDPNREDFGYLIPHVDWTYGAQRADGLLDVLRDEITFGLFTFDALTSPSTDVPGDFSFYYGTPAGSAGTHQLDWGVKNRTAARGGLVDPTAADTVGALRSKNDIIQQRIRAAIPHRGGPTGAALADILAYVEQDPRMRSYDAANNPLGDPFAACRPRHVILITDGRPSFDGRFGYEGAAAVAQELLTEHGVRTHVVGFAVGNQSELDALDDIAYHGGTTEAQIANTQTQLVGTLSAVLGELSTGVESRTRPAITTVTRNQPVDRQYRFYAARISVAGNPVDREGILEQEVWGCRTECRDEDNTGSAALCEIDDLGHRLNLRGDPRVLRTIDGDPNPDPARFTPVFSVQALDESNPALTPHVLDIPDRDEYPYVAMFPGAMGMEMPFGHIIGEQTDGTILPMSLDDKKSEYVRQLIEYVNADPGSRRVNHRLGAIFRSSPTIQTAPARWLSNRGSFLCYAEEHKDRPTMLYTSTHDGVFHAFRVDRQASLTYSQYGQERWGFVPGFALRKLQLLDDSFVQLGDGEPAIAEVLPQRVGANAAVADECAEWRSIGVVPAGGKGRGLFALDLTEPETWADTMFLWEVTPHGRCWALGTGLATCESGTLTEESDFGNLGYQKARPVIGTVFIQEGGAITPTERALVFFGGGDDPDDEQVGRSFFVVDLLTGKKIVEFNDANGNVDGGQNNAHLDDHPVVGTPVAYSTAVGHFVSRIFVGDAGGRLWRVSINSTDPADWRMELFHDAYGSVAVDDPGRAPIWDPPAVAASRHRGRLVVIYSTGNLDAGGSAGTRTMFSLIEQRNGSDIEAGLNWYYDFPEGEQPVGEPIIFDQSVYFTSYVQPADLCEVGKARLWAVDYMATEAGGAPKPKLDADGDPLTFEAPVLYTEFEDTIPQGVRIIREPSCSFGDTDFLDGEGPRKRLGALDDFLFGDANAGAPGGASPGAGGMRIVMQKGGNPSTAGQPQPPPDAQGSSEARIARSGGIPIAMPSVQVLFQSWATIFD